MLTADVIATSGLSGSITFYSTLDGGFALTVKTGGTTTFAGPISQHHEYDHGEGKPMIAKMQKDLEVLRQWLAA